MSEEPNIETKAVKTNWVGLIALLIIAGLLFQCVNSSIDSSRDLDQPTYKTPEPPTWSAPAGYSTAVTDNGVPIGIKWHDRPRCDLGDWCFAADIVTSVNCPHFYASITLLDKSGTNIGWTNDSAQGIVAGEKTSLNFHGYQSGVTSARIAETKCY